MDDLIIEPLDLEDMPDEGIALISEASLDFVQRSKLPYVKASDRFHPLVLLCEDNSTKWAEDLGYVPVPDYDIPGAIRRALTSYFLVKEETNRSPA